MNDGKSNVTLCTTNLKLFSSVTRHLRNLAKPTCRNNGTLLQPSVKPLKALHYNELIISPYGTVKYNILEGKCRWMDGTSYIPQFFCPLFFGL